MIFGTLGAGSGVGPLDEYLAGWGLVRSDGAVEVIDGPSFRIGIRAAGVPILDRRLVCYRDAATGVAVAGRIDDFDREERARVHGLSPRLPLGPLLTQSYGRAGSSLFAELSGGFAIAACDPSRNRLVLARDHFGIDALYYHIDADSRVHFSDRLDRLRAFAGLQAQLDTAVVLRYLLLRYNPGFETIFRGVRKLRPGHVLAWDAGRVREEPYWRLSYRDPHRRTDAEHAERLRGLIEASVGVRLGSHADRAGAYLSGGMDSSSVVSLMASLLDEPVHTFSFRCRGESFDEAAFARSVSRKWRTEHHEVEFGADRAVEIAELARLQSEPLSDVGIEVSTFVLAGTAAGVVDFVQTGDGGDELFAGHPVYMADRLARWYEAIPAPLRRPLDAGLQLLPDRPEKKSPLIKAQRFAYSVGFPADLHSNRWRISYKPDELRDLLSPDWRAATDQVEDPLQPLRVVYGEADGPDFLSRTLYGDYFTVVDFYLRRMEVLGRIGIAPRFPLLDRTLVEYAARIPSELKIASDAATKHLLRAAVSEVLPEEVRDRRDKLGNSVPLKNWLRESPDLQSFVLDTLSPDSIRRRGVFSPAYVDRLWRRHLSGRENNSHRIWSLVTFELWCGHHL